MGASKRRHVPIALRPHHLLCMLTFAGHGYSDEFTAGFAQIVNRLKHAESCVLVDGPDDICAGLGSSTAAVHCRAASSMTSDAAARSALVTFVELRPLFDGASAVLEPALIGSLRRSFAAGTIRAACAGCEWSQLCTRIAAEDFVTTKL